MFGFIIAETSTSLLTQLVLKHLSDNGMFIVNCRGQGYNNGANMKGKNAGMQNRIRLLEPRAFFVPYAAHSFNWRVNDDNNSERL